MGNKMGKEYNHLHQDIKECETHAQLLRVISKIESKKANLQLDHYQMDKLESAGLQRYEQIERSNTHLMKNKKIGFNDFGDDD
jgi:hypothetical protein